MIRPFFLYFLFVFIQQQTLLLFSLALFCCAHSFFSFLCVHCRAPPCLLLFVPCTHLKSLFSLFLSHISSFVDHWAIFGLPCASIVSFVVIVAADEHEWMVDLPQMRDWTQNKGKSKEASSALFALIVHRVLFVTHWK